MLIAMPLIIITGLLLLNITPLRQFIFSIGGLHILMNLHFLLACTLAAFLVTHIYLSTMGHTPLSHFKTMWTGWEDSHSPHP
jgi:thiosulfate reductase cytochrome b subunit